MQNNRRQKIKFNVISSTQCLKVTQFPKQPLDRSCEVLLLYKLSIILDCVTVN